MSAAEEINWQALFPGRFVAAAEFGGAEIPKEPTWTIDRVEADVLESLDSKKKERSVGIVYFRDQKRGWVLNKTNAICLAAMWGERVSGWLGKRVTLFAAPVRLGPKMTIGIRVKGSPDISGDMDIEIKLPKKSPIPWKLVVTGRRPEPSAEDLRKWAAAAIRARGWTKEQVLALLGGPAADVPAERRADVVAVLKGPPPPPPGEPSGEDDIP